MQIQRGVLELAAFNNARVFSSFGLDSNTLTLIDEYLFWWGKTAALAISLLVETETSMYKP